MMLGTIPYFQIIPGDPFMEVHVQALPVIEFALSLTPSIIEPHPISPGCQGPALWGYIGRPPWTYRRMLFYYVITCHCCLQYLEHVQCFRRGPVTSSNCTKKRTEKKLCIVCTVSFLNQFFTCFWSCLCL